MEISVSQEYAFVPQDKNESFDDVGFGPFVVQRRHLIDEIIDYATPKKSVHINGCRGSGKTTVLNQIGLNLIGQNKTVFLFESATALSRESVIRWVKSLILAREEVWLLIDETQNNVEAELFTLLLKNTKGHKITTIGAGVPEYQSMSQRFKKRIDTDQLFLTSNQMLVDEGVVQYFKNIASGINGAADTDQVDLLIEHLRNYVGGHVYPLMWLSEKLVPMLAAKSYSADEVINYLGSSSFRQQEDFAAMVDRILPTVAETDIRPLLYKVPDPNALYDLRRKGFCDKENKIISQLLFQEFIAKLSPSATLPSRLVAGVDGIRQLLQFALPHLDWTRYMAFGGPVEDALTLELLIILAGVSHLTTRLFNPKLINAGTASRKPDLYFNTSVDSFVECVLTTANNATEVAKLDEHIARFYATTPGGTEYYQIGHSNFAILNYQQYGDQPMLPGTRFRGHVFDTRVFTFLMGTKEVFLGSARIGP